MKDLTTNSILLAQVETAKPAVERGPAMETVEATGKAFSDSLVEAFNPLIELAPRAIAALVILVLGYLIAKMISKAAAALTETIGMQTAAERSGLAESMQQVGIRRNVPAIIGMIVFWLLMCVAIMAGFRVLELTLVSEAMQDVVNYIPRLLVAMVVVVIGLLVANFVRGVVATGADRVGISYAEQLASACYYILAIMTFITAFEKLKFEFALLNQMILIAFGALSVGFAIAFGLGGRDVLGGILSGYYIRQRFQAGDKVSVGEMSGTVREVGPVATIVESEVDGLTHRHSVPNHVMLKEAIR